MVFDTIINKTSGLSFELIAIPAIHNNMSIRLKDNEVCVVFGEDSKGVFRGVARWSHRYQRWLTMRDDNVRLSSITYFFGLQFAIDF